MNKMSKDYRSDCQEDGIVMHRIPTPKLSPYMKEVQQVYNDLISVKKFFLQEIFQSPPFEADMEAEEKNFISERISCPGDPPLETLEKHLNQFAMKYGGCCYEGLNHISLFSEYAPLVRDIIKSEGQSTQRIGLNLASRFCTVGVASRLWLDACFSIDHDNCYVREKVIELVGLLAFEGIQDGRSMTFVRKGLSDPVESIRAEAAMALANLAVANPIEKECIGRINELLDSDDDEVMKKVLTALSQLCMFGVNDRSTLIKLNNMRPRYDDVGTLIKELQRCLRLPNDQ